MSEHSSEQWWAIDDLFGQALDLPPEDRNAFLDQACPDSRMRQKVQRLLDLHRQAKVDFLQNPADWFDAPLLPGLDNDTHMPVGEGERRIGHYRLLRQIGEGGMGVVYLAERADGQFRQQVALKVLRQGLPSTEMVQRFKQERQILAGLQHANIARLLDGGVTDQGLQYFVMEYVDGMPITDYCDAHGLGVDERLDLFEQVCGAVEYAHQHLVVHRDLKPSNILVTGDGT